MTDERVKLTSNGWKLEVSPSIPTSANGWITGNPTLMLNRATEQADD